MKLIHQEAWRMELLLSSVSVLKFVRKALTQRLPFNFIKLKVQKIMSSLCSNRRTDHGYLSKQT